MENLSVEDEIERALKNALEPGFEIYDFVCVPGKQSYKIRIYLDKPGDEWGTPSVSDCESFCRKCDPEILRIAEQGKIPNDYILEVSSPGAERVLRNEEEWKRFQDKPMKIKFSLSGDKSETIIATFIRSEAGMTYWKQYQTKKDRRAKKKNADRDYGIKFSDIHQVKLYLDF